MPANSGNLELQGDAINQQFTPFPDEVLNQVGCNSYDDNAYNRHVYARVRTNDSGEAYIDVYFINKLIYYPRMYRRFVIVSGQRLSPKDEDEFVFLCRNTRLDIYPDDFIILQESFSKDFWSKLPMKVYCCDEIGMYLMKIYFCTHDGGARKILYESGLDRLATNLDDIKGYNSRGRSSERILGMPVRLIETFERNGLIDKISSKADRDNAIKLYNRFPTYFSDDNTYLPNKCQWKYLEEHESIGYGIVHDSIYQLLNDADDQDYSLYKSFVSIIEKFFGASVEEISNIPRQNRLVHAVGDLEMIVSTYRSNNELDKQIADMSNRYDFASGKYTIVSPTKYVDVLDDSYARHSDFSDYSLVEKLDSQKAAIVFVRRVECPKVPLAGIEIVNNRVHRVTGRDYKMPERDVYEFVEAFSNKYGLKFSPGRVVMRDYDVVVEFEGLDDDMSEYLAEHKNGSRR